MPIDPNQEKAKRIFGADAASYVPAISALSKQFTGFEYKFLPHKQFPALLLSDRIEAMRV